MVAPKLACSVGLQNELSGWNAVLENVRLDVLVAGQGCDPLLGHAAEGTREKWNIGVVRERLGKSAAVSSFGAAVAREPNKALPVAEVGGELGLPVE